MAITNGYATAADVMAELGQTVPIDRQARIERAVESASRMIDRYTGRRFWQDSTVQTREFYADDSRTLESTVGAVLDISTTTGLIVKTDTDDDGTFETTLTISTHFVLTPPNAADDSLPYTGIRVVDSDYYLPTLYSGRPGVQVTAKFGFAAVPTDIETACILHAISLYKGTDAVFGVFQWADGGGASRVSGMSPQVRQLLDPYCLPRVG